MLRLALASVARQVSRLGHNCAQNLRRCSPLYKNHFFINECTSPLVHCRPALLGLREINFLERYLEDDNPSLPSSLEWLRVVN